MLFLFWTISADGLNALEVASVYGWYIQNSSSAFHTDVLHTRLPENRRRHQTSSISQHDQAYIKINP
jgi:hypothetical protein